MKQFSNGNSSFIYSCYKTESVNLNHLLASFIKNHLPAPTASCKCDVEQTMNHVVDACPIMKFNGSLTSLHKTDYDATNWLKTMAVKAIVKRNFTPHPRRYKKIGAACRPCFQPDAQLTTSLMNILSLDMFKQRIFVYLYFYI